MLTADIYLVFLKDIEEFLLVNKICNKLMTLYFVNCMQNSIYLCINKLSRQSNLYDENNGCENSQTIQKQNELFWVFKNIFFKLMKIILLHFGDNQDKEEYLKERVFIFQKQEDINS